LIFFIFITALASDVTGAANSVRNSLKSAKQELEYSANQIEENREELESELKKKESDVFGTVQNDDTEESEKPSFMSKLNKKADEASVALTTGITEITDAIKHSLHEKKDDKEHEIEQSTSLLNQVNKTEYDGVAGMEDDINDSIKIIEKDIDNVKDSLEAKENTEEGKHNDKTHKNTSLMGKLNSKTAAVASAMTAGALGAAYALKDSLNSDGKENMKKNEENVKNEEDSAADMIRSMKSTKNHANLHYGPHLEHEILSDTGDERPTSHDKIENGENKNANAIDINDETIENIDDNDSTFAEEVKDAATMVVGEIVQTAEAIKNSLKFHKSDEKQDEINNTEQQITTENDEIPSNKEKDEKTAVEGKLTTFHFTISTFSIFLLYLQTWKMKNFTQTTMRKVNQMNQKRPKGMNLLKMMLK
jgi:hypothetical protein